MVQSIYLKSNNWSDALALASVLACENSNFKIVRKSDFASIFNCLPNVSFDYHKQGDNLITIEHIEGDSWHQKCMEFCDILGLEKKKEIKPFLPPTLIPAGVKRICQHTLICLLYLFPHPEDDIDLMMIDSVAKYLQSKNYTVISGGSHMLPCIKGTKDLRQVIDLPTLCAIKDSLSVVITTEQEIVTICDALAITSFVVSGCGPFSIDGITMSDSNQIINYISTKL